MKDLLPHFQSSHVLLPNNSLILVYKIQVLEIIHHNLKGLWFAFETKISSSTSY